MKATALRRLSAILWHYRIGAWRIDRFGVLSVADKKMRNAMLANEKGKIGWILLWALGVPIPVLFILFVVRGCT
jgi:hypothetical protein